MSSQISFAFQFCQRAALYEALQRKVSTFEICVRENWQEGETAVPDGLTSEMAGLYEAIQREESD